MLCSVLCEQERILGNCTVRCFFKNVPRAWGLSFSKEPVLRTSLWTKSRIQRENRELEEGWAVIVGTCDLKPARRLLGRQDVRLDGG